MPLLQLQSIPMATKLLAAVGIKQLEFGECEDYEKALYKFQ